MSVTSQRVGIQPKAFQPVLLLGPVAASGPSPCRCISAAVSVLRPPAATARPRSQPSAPGQKLRLDPRPVAVAIADAKVHPFAPQVRPPADRGAATARCRDAVARTPAAAASATAPRKPASASPAPARPPAAPAAPRPAPATMPRSLRPAPAPARAPSAVSATPRPSRSTSATPSSASSARTCCATAAWVTFSARAACDEAAQPRRRFEGAQRGQRGKACASRLSYVSQPNSIKTILIRQPASICS